MSKAQESMAKVLRLQKQRRLLDAREREMVSRGLDTLDELDAAEAAEKAALEEQESRARALSEASVCFADPTLDPEAFVDLPDSFWSGLAFSGVASEVEGSSSGIAPAAPGS